MTSLSAVDRLRAKVAHNTGPVSAAVIQHPAINTHPGERGTLELPADLRAEVEIEANEAEALNASARLERAMGILYDGAFEDQFGDFNICIPVGARQQVMNIESEAGKDAIRHVLHSETGKFPPKAYIENIQAMIRIATRSNGKKRQVFQRIATVNGSRLIDLGDPAGNSVCVRPGQWELIQVAPAAFRRGRGYGALPIPEPSGSPRKAFRIVFEWLVSLGVPKSRGALVVVALVAWLRTSNTYPLLLLYGQPGSGKTVAARLILSLIDPKDSGALPNVGTECEHIGAAAQHRHILSFDNLSKLSGQVQDTLCICATGGEIVGRKLYSNGDVSVLPIHRPVLMTAVQPVITRPDLLSRAIPIEFGQREIRKREDEIMTEFMERRPALLGALCDLLAATEART